MGWWRQFRQVLLQRCSREREQAALSYLFHPIDMDMEVRTLTSRGKRECLLTCYQTIWHQRRV